MSTAPSGRETPRPLESAHAPQLSTAIEVTPRTAYLRFGKPAIDLVVGLFAALVTLPIVVIAAVAIWVSLGGSPLYTQRRVGRRGKQFTIFKLKTMIDDRRSDNRRRRDRRKDAREEDTDRRGEDRRTVHKSQEDPRVTRVGRFLRTWSIDELPQFWNVVEGNMSLIGPRPELVEIVEEKYEPWQHQRHLVRPGLTGLWQISERSADALMYERTELDLEYVQTLSLKTDLTILIKTVPAVLGLHQGH
ncbi:MAG: sugar transferase [Acidimicrobiia bacterium]|nr:sugar transferase [Acidimicrobiia bacterium]